MKRNFVMLLAVLVAAVFAVETTNAAVPMLLTHQGRLLDAADQPVTGTRDLTFRIYDVPTAGAALWTEAHLAVPVSNGLFSVILGSTITLSGDLLVTGGTLETARYLEVQVAADPPLSPRMRLAATPYAVGASRMSGDVETLPGEMKLSNMSGSTTATVRAIDDLADGISDLTLGHSGGMGGSTTATIRAGVGQAHAICQFSDGSSEDVTEMRAKSKDCGLYIHIADLTGINGDQTSELVTDSGGSKLGLVSGPITGMMGSTTATIRTGATAGGGGGGGGALQQAYTATGNYSDGVSESSVEQVSNAAGSSSRWRGMSGSTTGTIRMMASPDSAVFIIEHDADGDGTARARGIIKETNGSGVSRLSFDTDNDGVEDMSSETVVDSGGARLAIKTKGTGAQRGEMSISHDSDGDGIAESSKDDDCDGISARTSWTGVKGGSTTGTIRMAASPDTVIHADSITALGALKTTTFRKTHANGGTFEMKHNGSTATTTLSETCDGTSATRLAIKTKGTSAGRVSIVADDSSTVACENDADGDGNSEARVTVTARDAQGNPVPGLRISADTDDNGVANKEVDVDCGGAESRIKVTNIGSSGEDGVALKSGTATVSGSLSIAAGGTLRTVLNNNNMLLTSLSGLPGVLDTAVILKNTGRLGISVASPAHPIEHSSGAHLTVGGTWTNASDKNAKENFSDVDGEELLEKIEDLAITKWNYKSEDESITHIGPTAQDFKRAFGVGGDDKSISTVDPSGIALAAIKELIKQNQELMKNNEELNKRVKALEKKQPN